MTRRMPETISTERLTLSPFTPDDIASLMRICTNVETMRWIGPVYKNDNDAYWQIAQFTGHWAHHGRGVYAVRAADGRAIGWCGIFRPPLFPVDEIGYLIDAGQSGKGYASEAVCAVVAAWKAAPDGEPYEHLVSFIHPSNTSSVRLADRVGAPRVGVAAQVPYAPDVYSHTGHITDGWLSSERPPAPPVPLPQQVVGKAKAVLSRLKH